MGPGTNASGTGSTPKPYDDGAWGYNVNGHGANGTASSAPAGWSGGAGGPNADCGDCHALGSTHNDGTLNSAETGTNTNANTAHLIPALIGTSTPNYDVQLTFDNACYTTCHQGASVTDMRHDRDGSPAANVMQFGTHLTVADGESIAYPVDSDISTNASTAAPDFGTCVSCHNPHGTNVDETVEGRSTNRMVRAPWLSINTLCLVCHI
jgi:hypothetical protein